MVENGDNVCLRQAASGSDHADRTGQHTFRQNRFPDYVSSALEKRGLKTGDRICSVLPDITPNGSFADCFLYFDAEGLYIADGEIHVSSREGKPCTAQVEKIRAFPIAQIEEPESERSLSTARQLAKSGVDADWVAARHRTVKLK